MCFAHLLAVDRSLCLQSYVKPWIITLIEQLLGCRNINGSGFLWQVGAVI